MGVTYFDQAHKFFTDNYDELISEYIVLHKPHADLNKEDRSQMENLHKGYLDELRQTFSNALEKDRMYKHPCGFVDD